MKLKLGHEDLEAAVARSILSPDQSTELWNFLVGRHQGSSHGVRVMAFLGALVVISSMTWFATRAFSESNPWILLGTGIVYTAVFLTAGLRLRQTLRSAVPAMLCFLIAAFMVPLTTYAFQRVTGLTGLDFPGSYQDFYRWIHGGWFFMEAATIAVSLVFLRLFGFEILTLPLAFSLWFLSMDLTPILFGQDFSWEDRRVVSVYFGLTMLIAAYGIDLVRKDRDYAFWLYLFGLTTFWCAISFSSTDSLLLKFAYCAMNLALVVIAILFRRMVFLVLGSLGVFLFLLDLANNVFASSLWFPLYLSLVGAAILGGAVWLFRWQDTIDAVLESKLPAFIKKLIPRYR